VDKERKITILDVINNNEVESFVSFCVLLIFIITISVTYNEYSNKRYKEESMIKVELSKNKVVTEAINNGYDPIAAGCAVDNNSNACTILSARVDIKCIKDDILEQ